MQLKFAYVTAEITSSFNLIVIEFLKNMKSGIG